jgi:hypothetical protein
MDRLKWLKRVNVVLFFLLLFQVISALLSEVINPNVFEVIHPTGGILLFMCALTHIGLNWSWVKTAILKPGKRAR